jgi:nucleotide-binding universal stress UspA family protein
MIALKNVLVATDFSEPSATALEYGRALARTFGATLHVLHVVNSVFTGVLVADSVSGAYAVLQKELEESGRKQLDTVLGEDDRRELNGRAILRTFTAPATGIVAYAKEENIDLIVLGTHGRSGWSHFLLGSVAEKVLRTAPCPVLTVRHPEHEFIAPDALVPVSHS